MIQNGSEINAQSIIRVRAFEFLLPVIESGFWCSRNAGPAVIWIIFPMSMISGYSS